MHEGFDIGLEMSGAPKAFEQMVDHMIMGGKIAMLGIPAVPTPVDWNKVIFKALTIKGIYGREMFETWYKMIAMLQSGLDVRKVITHRMKAADYAQGFALMKQGQLRQGGVGLGVNSLIRPSATFSRSKDGRRQPQSAFSHILCGRRCPTGRMRDHI